MRGTIGIALAGVIVGAAACQEGPTGTPWGYVAAAVTDDPSITNGFPGDPDGGTAGGGAQQAGASFRGQFEAVAEIAILRNGSGWVVMGPATPVAIPLQSEPEAAAFQGRGGMPVGTYTRARLTLSGARAELMAGSHIGGEQVSQDTLIRVGQGEAFVIEKDIAQFTLTSRTRVRVLFDLNAQDWLDARTLRDAVVDAEKVRAATVVLRIIEPR
jgi:hypothetical protein